MLSATTVIKRSDDIVHSDMDGEIVMMSIEQGEYYGIDAIGSDIWNILESEMSIHEICTKLCEKYDVEREQCAQDVLKFLTKMHEMKVIETA